tara:strand:- start:649 stop:1062 length:414 start_codon:yes stop_codon:yes gene_type:complete
MKKCNQCKKIKSLDEYFKATTSSDGKAHKCKKCNVENRREWVKKNPEKYKAQLERRKNNPWYKNRDNMMPKIKQQREQRKKLSDSYIIQLLVSPGTAGQNLSPEDIPDEMIKAYRINLQLKRALGKTPKLKEQRTNK